jgi:ABC-type transport system involved in cytochrome c biogenesis permease component
MGPIFFLTLADNLRSLRFQLSLVLLLVFFVGNGLVYTWKGERVAVENEQVAAAGEKVYESIESVSDAVSKRYRIISYQTGTEFMAEAGSDWFQYALNLTPETQGWQWFGSSRGTNWWLRRFEVVDWAFIIRYVISFLAIALTYNAISGERESGTLRLLLANPVPRAHVLVAKYLAHLLSLVAAVTVGAVVSLLMLGLSGTILFNGGLVVICLLFLGATAVYASVFLLLGLAVSAATGRSATSLITLILVWALLIVVIPQTSRFAALTTLDPLGDTWEEADELVEQANLELERQGVALRPLERARVDGFDLEQRYARRYNQLDAATIQLERKSMRGRLEQYRRARLVNSVSPGFAFQYTLEGITANGIQRYEHFEPQAWGYLEALRQFLEDRDARDPDSPHVPLFSRYMSEAPLDHRQIPRFVENKLTISESISGAMGPITTLLVEALAALWLAMLAFHRASIAEGADD